MWLIRLLPSLRHVSQVALGLGKVPIGCPAYATTWPTFLENWLTKRYKLDIDYQEFHDIVKNKILSFLFCLFLLFSSIFFCCFPTLLCLQNRGLTTFDNIWYSHVIKKWEHKFKDWGVRSCAIKPLCHGEGFELYKAQDNIPSQIKPTLVDRDVYLVVMLTGRNQFKN